MLRHNNKIEHFRRRHKLDLRAEQRKIWLAQLGGLIVPLPNFRWRREIIEAHDSHHIVTGYPPSFSGELCVAAWELGSGCYTDWRANMLCAGLMALGLVLQTRATIEAYQLGNRARMGREQLYPHDIPSAGKQ